MKLSEAIRLGAMLKPQAFDSFSDGDGTCALGAAIDACGGDVFDCGAMVCLSQLSDANDWHLWDIQTKPCPVISCSANHGGVEFADINLIPHLNDEHRWTREQIADWVQTIEDANADTEAAILTLKAQRVKARVSRPRAVPDVEKVG